MTVDEFLASGLPLKVAKVAAVLLGSLLLQVLWDYAITPAKPAKPAPVMADCSACRRPILTAMAAPPPEEAPAKSHRRHRP